MVFDVEVRHVQRNLRDGIAFVLGDETILGHFLEDEIAATYGVFGIANRAIPCGGIDHTGHQSAFLDIHLYGFLVEEGAGCGANTKGIMSKSHGVQVHGDDFFLRIVVLQLGCGNPFLELAKHEFGLAEVFATREEVLGQLLRNGTTAAFLPSRQHTEGHAEQGSLVDARVIGETFILNADEGFGHVV